MAYQKLLSSRIFKNDMDKFPTGPAMGNGKVVMLEDCRQGEEVQIALWKGTDRETGEPSISVSISKKMDGAAPAREQRVYQEKNTLDKAFNRAVVPLAAQPVEDDVPF